MQELLSQEASQLQEEQVMEVCVESKEHMGNSLELALEEAVVRAENETKGEDGDKVVEEDVVMSEKVEKSEVVEKVEVVEKIEEHQKMEEKTENEKKEEDVVMVDEKAGKETKENEEEREDVPMSEKNEEEIEKEETEGKNKKKDDVKTAEQPDVKAEKAEIPSSPSKDPGPPLPNHTPKERSESIHRILSKFWGYENFRGHQESAVMSGIEGKDSFVCMATGAGKSICYQVPPLYTGRTTVVISPLLSLMADQVLGLTSRGISADYLCPLTDYRRIETKFLSGELSLLYLTPERLSVTLDLLERAVKKNLVGLFAVDEAHCISEWGHEFRKEFRQVSALRERYPGIPIMALTATATKAVQKDIIQVLHLKDPLVVRSSFNRPNIHFDVRLKTDMRQDLMNAFEEIARFTDTEQPSILIYCPIVNDTEKVRTCLEKIGIKAATYHGKVPLELRDAAHKDFVNGHIQAIVATSAFGMGVDKPNTRGVINYGIAKSVETYYQQAGRAGRDGGAAKSIMFYRPGDFHTWAALAKKDLMDNSLEQEAEARRLQKMQFLAATTSCRRKILVEYFDDELDPSEAGEWCCDNCEKKDRVTKNLADDAVLLLKAIRLRNRFGRAIPIDMLCGVASKSVKQFRLDHEKAFFGKGVHHTRAWWKALVTVLMEKKLLMETVVHGCKLCKISEPGRELIATYDRAKVAISSGKPNPPALPTLEIVLTDEMLAAEMPSALNHVAEFGSEGEKRLFLEMKTLRAQLSRTVTFPPLTDATLEQLVRVRPTNAHNFVSMKGIGRKKLERYGKPFMNVIKSVSQKYGLETDLMHPKKAPSSSSSPLVTQSLSVPEPLRSLINLWNQGKSVREICSIQKEQPTTIYTHLAQLVVVHGCEIDLATPQLQLDPEQLGHVEIALQDWTSRSGNSSLPSPHKLHEHLGGSDDYSFGMLKLVLTVHQKKRETQKKRKPHFDPLTPPRKCSTQVPPTAKPYVPAAMDDDIVDEEDDFWAEIVRTCPDLDAPQNIPSKVQSQQNISPEKRKRVEGSHDGLAAKRLRSTHAVPFSQPPPQPQNPKFSSAALSLATASRQLPGSQGSRVPGSPSSPTLSPFSPTLSPTLSPEPTKNPSSPQLQRTPSRAPFLPSLSTPPSSPLSQKSSSQRSPAPSPKKPFSQSSPISSPQNPISPTLLPSSQPLTMSSPKPLSQSPRGSSSISSPYFSKHSSPKPPSPSLSSLKLPMSKTPPTSPQPTLLTPPKPISPSLHHTLSPKSTPPPPTSPHQALSPKPTSPSPKPISPLPRQTLSPKPTSPAPTSPHHTISPKPTSPIPHQTLSPKPTSPAPASPHQPISPRPALPSPKSISPIPRQTLSPKPSSPAPTSPHHTIPPKPAPPSPKPLLSPSRAPVPHPAPKPIAQTPPPSLTSPPPPKPFSPSPMSPSKSTFPSQSPQRTPPPSSSAPFPRAFPTHPQAPSPTPHRHPTSPQKPISPSPKKHFPPSPISPSKPTHSQHFPQRSPTSPSTPTFLACSQPSPSPQPPRASPIATSPAPKPPTTNPPPHPSSPLNPPPRAKSVSPCTTNRSPVPFPRSSASTPPPNGKPIPQTFYPATVKYAAPSAKSRARAALFEEFQESIPMTDRLSERRQLSRASPSESSLGSRKLVGSRVVPIRPGGLREANRGLGDQRRVGCIQPATPTRSRCAAPTKTQPGRPTPPGRPQNGNARPQPSRPPPPPQESVRVYSSPQHAKNIAHKRQIAASKAPLPPREECDKVENVTKYILGAAAGGISEKDVLAHFRGRASQKTVAVALDQLQLQFSVYKNGDQYYSM